MAYGEGSLLQRYVARHDAEAFTLLVERHRDMVFSVCKRILHNGADAEDAAQDCFLELARRAPSLRPPIAGWLHCVAVRVSMKMTRQRAARSAREIESMSRRLHAEEPSWAEIQDVVDEVVAALPPKLREPMVLHYLEGMNQAKVAVELGVTRSAVSKRLAAGIEIVRKRLNRGGVVVAGLTLATLLSTKAVEAAPASLSVSLGKVALTGLASGGKVGVAAAAGGSLKMGILSAMVAAIVVSAGVFTYFVTRKPAAVPHSAPVAGDVFSGKVLLPNGNPARGATVRIFYCHDAYGYGSRWLSEGATNDHGDFTIVRPEVDAPPVFLASAVARYYIVGALPGYAPGAAEALDAAPKGNMIVLSPARTVICHVSTPDGHPVEGAEVEFIAQSEPLGITAGGATLSDLTGEQVAMMEAGKVATNAMGAATLVGLPAGRRGILQIAKPGLGACTKMIDDRSETESATLTPNSMQLRGRIVSAETGGPLGGTLVSQFPGRLWTVTGPDGRFDLAAERLPDNSAALFVCDPSPHPQYARAGLAGSDTRQGTDLTIAMSSGTLVTGRIVNSRTGDALNTRTLFTVLRQQGGVSPLFEGLTDVRGAFAFRVSGVDEIGISPFSSTGYALPGQRAFTRVDLKEGAASSDVAVDAVRERAIDVAVVNSDGSPADATVSILSLTDIADRARAPLAKTNCLGMIRFAGLADGEGLLLYAISRNGAGAGFGEVPAAHAGESPVRLVLQPARTGRVVLKDDRGRTVLGGASVSVGLSKESRTVTILSTNEADFGGDGCAVPGLLPGERYNVTVGTSRQFTLPGDGKFVWSVSEGEQSPTLVVNVKGRS